MLPEMIVASRTDTGRVRSQNEDAVFADTSLGLLIVADGMGGHRGGEVASRLAVTTIAEYLRGASLDGDAGDLLPKAICLADETILRCASKDPELAGMGTTAVVALCSGAEVYVAHVGDSRAYLLHDGQLRRLTEDHSLVNEMLRNGEITPREARQHHLRHYLMRSLGNRNTPRPDVRVLDWQPGDLLLLCSDGLTGMVAEHAIRRTLLRLGDDLEHACDELVRTANAKGGKDNISVLLARRN